MAGNSATLNRNTGEWVRRSHEFNDCNRCGTTELRLEVHNREFRVSIVQNISKNTGGTREITGSRTLGNYVGKYISLL